MLNATWLLKSTSGRTFVVSGTLNDPTKPVDTLTAIDDLNEAINLLAKSL